MEYLTAIDQRIFLLINHLPHNEFLDIIAQGLSGIGRGGLIWFVIAVVLFLREEKRDHWFFLPFIVAGALGSILSEIFIKFLIARPRPTVDIGAIILTDPGNYSFPSTHTTLAFALAYILSHEEPKLRRLFYGLAILISLSRIYLGVHYPVDIVCGAILGTAIGWGSFFMSRKIITFYTLHKKKS